MNYKISVIVPVYNVEKYIVNCLDSLLNQTLNEIEIILIEDKSLDSCGEICDEYALKDKRIKVFHNESNIGSGYSRNKGIELAVGEYIAFVDPDDWIDLDFYEKLYNKAKTDDFDIVKAERKKINVFGASKKETISKLNDEIKALMNNRPLFMLFTYEHTTAIYKKSLLLLSDAKYPNTRNSQDDVFLLQITFYCKKIGFVNGVFYNYRIHEESAIHRMDIIYFNSQIKKIEYEIIFLNSKKIDEDLYKMYFLTKLMITIHNLSKALTDTQIDFTEYEESFHDFLRIIKTCKYNLLNVSNTDRQFVYQGDQSKLKSFIEKILFNLSAQILINSKYYKIEKSSLEVIYQKYYSIRKNLLIDENESFIKKEIYKIIILLRMFLKFPEIIKYKMFWYSLFFKYILKRDKIA